MIALPLSMPLAAPPGSPFQRLGATPLLVPLRTSPVGVFAPLVIALWACAFLGCPKRGPDSTLPVLTTDNADAERDMREARAAMDNQEYDVAEAGFRRFLTTHPNDALAPVARLGLGRMLLARGETDAALQEFRAAAAHEDVRVSERGRFYSGVALQLRGESAEALELLRPMVGTTVSPADTALLLQTLAAAHARLGDRPAAVEALDLLVRSAVPTSDRDDARSQVEGLIRQLQTDDVQVLFDRLDRDGHAWPLVGRRALRDAFENANLDRVRTVASALREHRVPLDGDLRTMALRAERTTETDLRAVGAILPLSGRGQEVGRHALEGLMLAAGLPSEGPATPTTPRIFFRDSGDDPERAARAVDDLVTLHQVVAIVGPVGRDASLAAARRAQELGVPMLALSPDPRVVDAGPMVFRLLGTADDEALDLVTAARDRGARRIAVVAPTHAYGQAMTSAVRGHCEDLGLEFAGTVEYDPAALQQSAQRAAQIQADAFVLPDHSRSLMTLVPALTAAGLFSTNGGTVPRGARAVRFLVPSVGYDEALLRTTGRYLQGSLFARSFLAADNGESSSPYARSFAETYRARYQSSPDLYAAGAFDAFHLIRSAVDAGARTRGEVATRLPTSRTETVSISSRLSPTRHPTRATRIFELRGTSLTTPPRPTAPATRQ